MEALRNLEWNAIGIDLVPHEPLVIEGDIHQLAFKGQQFSLLFSNIIDHSLFPAKMISEMERCARPGGLLILHLQLGKPTDRFGVTEVGDADSVLELFQES